MTAARKHRIDPHEATDALIATIGVDHAAKLITQLAALATGGEEYVPLRIRLNGPAKPARAYGAPLSAEAAMMHEEPAMSKSTRHAFGLTDTLAPRKQPAPKPGTVKRPPGAPRIGQCAVCRTEFEHHGKRGRIPAKCEAHR